MAFNNLSNRIRYRYLRWRYKRRAKKTPLSKLYRQPLPDPAKTFTKARFVVLDCEMNGLNPRQHQILSLGWVVIENGKIQNASARHIMVNVKQGAGDSVMVHGIHDHMLEDGGTITGALKLLVKEAQNSILVFHHASIDLRFLQAASYKHFRCPLLLPYTDTMTTEKSKQERQGTFNGLRLQQCRERYNLPPVSLHNALGDALATAELFLAQIHYRRKPDDVTLRDLTVKLS